MEKGIEDLKKALATRKELEDTQEMTQVLKWVGELEPLVSKCKTRIDLGRKKLILTGTLLHEDVQVLPIDVSVNVGGVYVGGIDDVKFTKPNRIAVINDKIGQTIVRLHVAFDFCSCRRDRPRDVVVAGEPAIIAGAGSGFHQGAQRVVCRATVHPAEQ